MKHNNIDVLIEESPLHIEILLKFCGYHEKLPPGNVYGDVISGDYILQYCTCGKGEFIVDNKSFHIDKGDCMITFPGQMRIEKADDKEPWGLMWIGINGKSTEFLFQRLNITKENPVIKNLNQTEIPTLLKKIIDIAESIGFERDFLLAQKIFAFFDKIIESSNVTRNSLVMADNYVAQTVYYLDMHYSDKNISIEALAKNIGLNRSYLYKIFKERIGISPQEYLTKVRINKSLEFLGFQQATVTSVANSVGYEPSVFSKAFKKAIGITPKEYINKKISDN